MPPTAHPAQPARPGQLRPGSRSLATATLTLATLGLCVCAVGCDPGVDPMDSGSDGGVDAGVRPDGGEDASLDAGRDATVTDGGDAATEDGGMIEASCVSPEAADSSGTDALDDPLGRASVTIDDRDACHRAYTLTSTATLRDAQPDNPRAVVERAGWPTLRTGHDLFDALHALALEEVRENSVSAVRDYAFDDGGAVGCGEGGCFETGRLWHYVWTRDTAYSVHLGLAAMDPTRARNSLAFKLSERRGGGGLEIVQDTGSGGSYPVSTDRVAWALGAEELLHHLTGAEREAFRDDAYRALRNTVERDRGVVYDAEDGLYFGEQSFLDWREQTYPEWVTGDVVHIAMSKALGTNLLHLRALELTARLAAEVGDDDTRYLGWADALRAAIRARFWLEDEGMFSTFIASGLDPAPARRYDLLGSSLAILFGVASEAQASQILERYPHYGPGAPVIWPQQQDTRIYHNRGEWPFVTAYWLRAAQHAGHDAVADRMVQALFRGAAINLSNMENFEAASGAAWVEDGTASGPVVNSQRQLWSVAGYLSMVHHTLFGLAAEADGLHVRPFLTAGMRETLFAGTDTLVLNDYPWHGGTVSVVLHLPEAGGVGALSVGAIEVDGAALEGGDLLPLEPGRAHRVDVTLSTGAGPAASLTAVSDTDWQDVFGPRTPRISSVTESGGRLTLALGLNGEAAADVRWRLYRDGVVIADDLPGDTTSFLDASFDASGPRSPCYVAELTFASSGNHSQHSPPTCFWGSGTERITTIGAGAMTNVGGSGSDAHGRFHYEPWGDPGHSLTAPVYTATQTGPHLLQVTFGNGAGAVDTGITCGVARLVVEDVATGAVVSEGALVMPHLGAWSRWEDSSFVRAELTAGRQYRVVIRSDDEMVNMSVFEHFERYTGGLGGRSGAFGRVNIAELKILAR